MIRVVAITFGVLGGWLAASIYRAPQEHLAPLTTSSTQPSTPHQFEATQP